MISADPNRLLFVISVRGKMKWADYCNAFDFLSANKLSKEHTSNITATRSGLLQCFEALGHCDAYYENGQTIITASTASLCRLPRAGLPVAVLAGARCLKTQEQLAEAANAQNNSIQIITERYPGPLGLLPDTITIQSESDAALAAFTEKLGLRCPKIPPAWTFVNWCGTLMEYEKKLDYHIPEDFGWTRYDFCVNTHIFLRTRSDSLPRLSKYLNPTTTLPVYVFFRNGSGAEVDRNWGRYLNLNARGITVAAYDERRYRLCIPVRIPLPSVISRTVCLCSGKPPVHKSGEALVPGCECTDWLMYEDVPPQIALVALSKVGQIPAKVEIR